MQKLYRSLVLIVFLFLTQLISEPVFACVEGLTWGMDLQKVESHLGISLSPIKEETTQNLFEVKDIQISGLPVEVLRVRIENEDGLKQLAYEIDNENMTEGWTSLEANETFYGSSEFIEGGKSTGDPIKITICSGETNTCDKGETVQVGDSDYVSWKNQTKEENTYGLILAEKQNETTGGFLTGTQDYVDLSGYGFAEIECKGETKLKGIPVDFCTASMDPLDRSIQAKLVNSGELLDAVPGVLPVYFGSDVEMIQQFDAGAEVG